MSKLIKLVFLSLGLLIIASTGAIANNITNGASQSEPNRKVIKIHATISAKINRDQAVKIALSAHKHAKVLSVLLQENIYKIRLRTIKGKRTLYIGANTGRILKDTRDGLFK